MRQLLGSPTGHIDRDWTFPTYYLTDTGTGLLKTHWGTSEEADPEAVYKQAQAAWDRFDARLEDLGPLRYGVNDAYIREVKKEMAAIEHFMIRLSEHMERLAGEAQS